MLHGSCYELKLCACVYLRNNGYLHFIQQKGEIENKVFSLDIAVDLLSVCTDKRKKYNKKN